ncbi:DUF47 domain-containing protein [Pullulanibacillus sp. KACC 23026]|uniref:DUF47 domain-containing protein n=1 Tax=Pullulanibacillus sp. KACC 23026 TaxID=3028315 RepID=UPI0023AFC520|nr:DUF47 domain-containing protein [Pullulanibacillus sp. KACC 23026]WEG14792.1 DUF47 domain-containing protein [Pullulanibacillus sp. KACC 23026]
MALKKKDKFITYLTDMSINLKESATFFSDYKLTDENSVNTFYQKMKDYETKGDNYVHDLIKDLNNAFITTIDREDILSLAMSMDDVLDGLEQTSALFEMYEITKADSFMERFVSTILKCTDEIETAVEMLSSRKLLKIREHAIKIKDYESKCDDILRESIKHLFKNEKDAIRIIQYKEIYEELEEVADACQAVANKLESIIMKNG